MNFLAMLLGVIRSFLSLICYSMWTLQVKTVVGRPDHQPFGLKCFLNSTAHSLSDRPHTQQMLLRRVYFDPVCFRKRKWGAEEVAGDVTLQLYRMNPNHSFGAQANGRHL